MEEENVIVQEEPSGQSNNVFKIVAYLGVGGNVLVGLVSLFFFISGLSGTAFFSDIENESVDSTRVIISILLFLLVSILSLFTAFGLLKMIRKDFNGAKIFLISNGIWIVLTFLVLQDIGFYQLGIFSAIYTLVVWFMFRQQS